PAQALYARLRAGRSDFPLALRGVRAGRASGRPVVATGEALVLEPAQRELRRALAAMREKRLVARVPLEREAPAHARLLSPGEAAAEFADFPQALRLNAEVAAACALELPMGTPIFPDARPCAGPDPCRHLRELCERGLAE